MLCPEVWNFSPPKVLISTQQNVNFEAVKKTVNMNEFYRSLVITCPDETRAPSEVEEILKEYGDYYQVSDCPLATFLDKTFIDNFVMNGKVHCLSFNTDCLVHNCAAISSDGILTLHILDFVFQTLCLEGSKQLHNYYQVKIDLKNKIEANKTKQRLSKLGNFDLYVSWEPHSDNVCPSSIAKYFYDKNLQVSVLSPEIEKHTPSIEIIPSVEGADLEEMVEWIGMLCIGGDLKPNHDYISDYCVPESDHPISSTRISVQIIRGFFTPNTIISLCNKLSGHVGSRDLEHYWAGISAQTCLNSPWRWNKSTPSVFQSHDSSTSVFVSKGSYSVLSVGEIKIS